MSPVPKKKKEDSRRFSRHLQHPETKICIIKSMRNIFSLLSNLGGRGRRGGWKVFAFHTLPNWIWTIFPKCRNCIWSFSYPPFPFYSHTQHIHKRRRGKILLYSQPPPFPFPHILQETRAGNIFLFAVIQSNFMCCLLLLYIRREGKRREAQFIFKCWAFLSFFLYIHPEFQNSPKSYFLTGKHLNFCGKIWGVF